ncbi:hypothetical protein SVIOM342S_09095 [Streptomyces violaceorubidus]
MATTAARRRRGEGDGGGGARAGSRRAAPRGPRAAASASGLESARSASAFAAQVGADVALRVSERSTRPAVVYVAANAQADQQGARR